MNYTIKYKKLSNQAIEPTRGSAFAAGYDLYACPSNNAVFIAPGETVKIGTGIAIELPEGTFGGLYARSGLATKHGLRPGNCVGIIDQDFKGEVVVALHNDSDSEQCVMYGDRIAQLVVQPFYSVSFRQVESLEETERGAGGFGSTGK